ncbi:hypothetical protein [Glycomyces algeriensis]|uniref:Uncharacterized protein n=1 Tax=Glycomyces algeriensis TaxID=256037 RepID=A0A9W6G770_9ACTN|nr:hypothetical protein [Glycomyces algeriensis]MDA1368146.1 hypothetical protein [Glycomyces algeriensis]MDR7348871.1 hypothetical protein [Glycomyces algeriensis]GLI41574.1 hypothetical protein GALLR39Z86_14240 [Glycomyces algeriensis]
MGRIAGGSEVTRRFSVLRFLLGAALTAFGSLLLGAFALAASAWASDDSAASQGLAAMTDPLSAEVSDMSRLAARLIPQNQLGHRTTAGQGEVSGLVSGLDEPVVSLVDETDGAVRTALQGDAVPGLLDLDDESVGDRTAEVVVPLVGNLVKGTASIADGPASAVPGVYETVAPSTDPVDALARLVTDGLRLGDGTTPGSVPVGAAGQPSFTMLSAMASNEVAASLHGANSGRPAAAAECSAEYERGTERSTVEDVRGVPRTSARPWLYDGPGLPDLKVIPGGAKGSTAGVSVDSGHTAVCAFPSTAGEEVSLSRTVIGELGRPLDRAAELSVAPD